MADHGLALMQAIQSVLEANVPLAGGWWATRLETPIYPVGYVDLTGSNPGYGMHGYTEEHTGVVSVWTRAPVGQAPSPAEAMRLSKLAQEALGGGVLPLANITIQRLTVGRLVPSNPDGITWGRTFTFSATTHEENNGTAI